MAVPRTWLPRAEEIINVLIRMKSQHLDRSAVEELFQLQRRQAIEIMKKSGATVEHGYPSRVGRTSLLSWVQRISQAEAWQLERHQATADELSQSMAEVQAIRAALREAGKEQVKFPIVEEVLRASIASLPQAIRLEVGRITVEVDEPDPAKRALAACELLYRLGMAVTNDFATFDARVRGSNPGAEPPSLIAS